MAKLHISSTPHIHQKGSHTSKIMLDVAIALLPATVVGILFFGQTQADLPEGVEAEIWDANIWKPLEGGITLHIGG